MYRTSHIEHRALRQGFTLIEVLVALALFTTVVTIAVSGFLTVLRTDREIGTFISVQTNTDLVIEQMARELRTARNFSYLGGDKTTLAFTNYRNVKVLYCRQDFGGAGAILRVANAGGLSSCPPNKGDTLTADDVDVTSLHFYIQSATSPPLPPRITISASIAPVSPTQIPPVDLETTVSARNF